MFDNLDKNMVFELFENKKIVLYGASKQGQITLDNLKVFDITPEYFCDSDPEKWGQKFNGLEIISINQLKKLSLKFHKEVIVIITSSYVNEILDILSINEVACYVQIHTFIDNICNIYNKEPNEIIKYKDYYKGKRCFIIGNGPSLKSQDLEKLSNEITFAANKIFLLFDEIIWRPTFYSVFDFEMLKNLKNDLEKLDLENIFLPLRIKNELNLENENAIYLNFFERTKSSKEPFFSDDLSKMVCTGYTITYVMIQIAAYMGFETIYLLGVDHSYSKYIEDGKIMNSNATDYFSDKYINDNEERNLPDLSYTTEAYKKAKEYAEKNGIKIYNATRGGQLDIFERINIDELF